MAKPVSTLCLYRYLAILFTNSVNPRAGHWVTDFIETTLYCARFKKAKYETFMLDKVDDHIADTKIQATTTSQNSLFRMNNVSHRLAQLDSLNFEINFTKDRFLVAV